MSDNCTNCGYGEPCNNAMSLKWRNVKIKSPLWLENEAFRYAKK